MGRKTLDQKKHDELLKRAIELGAVRAKVVTPDGKTIYKDIDKIADVDDLVTRADGEPTVMKTKPGRRGKNVVTDGGPINGIIRERVRRRNESTNRDEILKTVKKNPDSPDVLNQVILGIGEEAASLAFERVSAEMDGKDTATLSSRRITALRALADTWLKRMEQVNEKTLDMDGPAFKKVFGFIVETFREAMTGIGYREEETDTILAKFSSLITDEWANEARNRIKR